MTKVLPIMTPSGGEIQTKREVFHPGILTPLHFYLKHSKTSSADGADYTD
jgi:hypothetical protein